MKLVIQRTKEASVWVNNNIVGSIPYGLVILVGFEENDQEIDIDFLVHKVIHLRIFDDENGKMSKSILEIEGSILSISQFTLYADTKKGCRPSFTHAMKRERAIHLYELWNQKLSQFVPVETGEFGAEMKVNLIGDGPITIVMESRETIC